MANEQNLIYSTDPNGHKLTREEQKMGGVASGKARRQKKSLKQIGDMIGALKITSPKKIKMLKDAGIEDDDLINDVGMLYRLNLKAQIGDAKAIELLAKLRGQMKEQISAEVAEVKPLVDLTARKKNNTK